MKNEKSFRFVAPVSMYQIQQSNRPTTFTVRVSERNCVVSMVVRGTHVSINEIPIHDTLRGHIALRWNGSVNQFLTLYPESSGELSNGFRAYVKEWYCTESALVI